MQIVLTQWVGDVRLEVQAESAEKAIGEFAYSLRALGAAGYDTSLADRTRKPKAVDIGADVTKGQEYAKDKAIRILTAIYQNAELRGKARELLGQFSVTRFSDVPLERAHDLLEAASKLQP